MRPRWMIHGLVGWSVGRLDVVMARQQSDWIDNNRIASYIASDIGDTRSKSCSRTG